MADDAQPEAEPAKTFRDFLESTPPSSPVEIADLVGEGQFNSSRWIYPLATPDIQLYCDDCAGPRYFYNIAKDPSWMEEKGIKEVFLTYICRNCRATIKTFAIQARHTGSSTGEAIKYGELPPFGPVTPARVITLIGPDRDLFLQGRRTESQGLGIGAFSYYRRVVENQKGRIIAEIARVAQRLGAKPEMLQTFKAAEKETQFSKAIEAIKGGIPDVLRIGSHNPLTLLHTALSGGLHEHTDKECLEIAQEIRLVLTELAERLSQALKEEAELQTAVSRLLNRKSGT
jgi:hypothetical protein